MLALVTPWVWIGIACAAVLLVAVFSWAMWTIRVWTDGR